MSHDVIDYFNKLNLDFDSIGDQKLCAALRFMSNAIEELAHENNELKEENQNLKDEISRLKGEQGKPNIRPQPKDGDISSEDERKPKGEKKAKGKRKKRKPISVDRTVKCQVYKSQLPKDIVYKGIEKLVIQDIVIKTDNVEFHREVYYSSSDQRAHLNENLRF